MMIEHHLRLELCKDFKKINAGFVINNRAMTLEVDSTLEREVRKGQLEDVKLRNIINLIKVEKTPGFHLDDQGTV